MSHPCDTTALVSHERPMMIHNIHNPNCDGSHCRSEQGEVRYLPTNESSGVFLCSVCFHHEMAWRKQVNKRVAHPFDILEWDSLEVRE